MTRSGPSSNRWVARRYSGWSTPTVQHATVTKSRDCPHTNPPRAHDPVQHCALGDACGARQHIRAPFPAPRRTVVVDEAHVTRTHEDVDRTRDPHIAGVPVQPPDRHQITEHPAIGIPGVLGPAAVTVGADALSERDPPREHVRAAEGVVVLVDPDAAQQHGIDRHERDNHSHHSKRCDQHNPASRRSRGLLPLVAVLGLTGVHHRTPTGISQPLVVLARVQVSPPLPPSRWSVPLPP